MKKSSIKLFKKWLRHCKNIRRQLLIMKFIKKDSSQECDICHMCYRYIIEDLEKIMRDEEKELSASLKEG